VSKRVSVDGATLSLPGSVQLTIPPTAFSRRTRVTLSMTPSGRAVTAVRLAFRGRLRHPALLLLPGAISLPTRPGSWTIVGPGRRGLPTGFDQTGTAQAQVTRGGMYALRQG
jgi:hypothetical protein